jgi:hypothetical protein
MDPLEDLILKAVKGEIKVEEVVKKIRSLYVRELDSVWLDLTRIYRRKVPELVFGIGKGVEDIISALRLHAEMQGFGIATKVGEDLIGRIKEALKGYKVEYFDKAQVLRVRKPEFRVKKLDSTVGLLAAGTSDVPIAEEARVIAETLGLDVIHSYDVGIAGLHRLFSALREMAGKAKVYIAVSGMEAALPSVVASIVDKPVIAVPTSIGYGVGAKGLMALASSLQSCPMGVATVNIDGGAQAAVLAYLMVTS